MEDGEVAVLRTKAPAGKKECPKVPITLAKAKRDAGNEKYYKKFDFFYRRTAFRTMTEYYKGLFRPNLDRWREQEKKQSLAALENPSGANSEQELGQPKASNGQIPLKLQTNPQ
jgi:hypothetical protein